MLKFPSPYDKVLPDEIKLERTPYYHDKDDICNRVIGSLVGLATGDALGASVEFRPRKYLAANPVRKMEGGGTWGLDAGKWTDDTSMALCLASSLITENGFNAYDQMVRYKWWHKHGYLSSTGHCFDIGKATRQSIIDFSARQKILEIHYRCLSEYEVDTLAWDSVECIEKFDVNCGDQNAAGNGALMRLAPIPLFYFKTPAIAIEYAGRSASLTHANKKAIDACRYYAALIIGALYRFSKDELLAKNFYSKHKDWFGEEPLHEDIKLIAEGSYKRKGGYEDGIRGKGYVVNALEAALWAFWSDENSFEKGALAAVNLGDDTDTTAAIHGQLAGAYYGYDKIPKDWLSKLYAHDLIFCMGEWLHFQGQERGTEASEYQHMLSKYQEQKQQQTVSALATSQSDHSKVDEGNDEFNKHMLYSKQKSTRDESKSKPNLNRAISLDSATNTATNRVASSKDAHSELTDFKSSKKSDTKDQFTITTHEHAFYPKTKYTDFQ
jgi:ADP-ribosyl-[dinitrogen reductase] hydrolase